MSISKPLTYKTIFRCEINLAPSKHAYINKALESWYKLVQNVPTRFGTTFDIVQRFIKSKEQVQDSVTGNTGVAAKEISGLLNSLLWEISTNNALRNLALDAITNCFGPISNLKTSMDSTYSAQWYTYVTRHLATPDTNFVGNCKLGVYEASSWVDKNCLPLSPPKLWKVNISMTCDVQCAFCNLACPHSPSWHDVENAIQK